MLKSFLSLFLKDNCPLCKRPTEDQICRDCSRQVKSYQFKNPRQFWQGDLPFLAWGKYDGKLKKAIATLKYDKHPQIGELFGYWLGETWQELGLIKTNIKPIVIPIPLHSQKQKERGFNQAEMMAKGFCQITKYPLKVKGLIRIRATEAMFGLNPQQRQENIKQAFELDSSFQKHPPQTPILLIDDIYTTGTTAKEVTKLLQKKGINVLGIAVIATKAPLIEKIT
ncbi:ComF family protein [Aphanothece sacrum]|uniref:Alpha-L-fucosidase n=1 Tax=Aphanothece sacrum FPU1 TaxID=1920663 RepID=A0A401IMB5_APHSA|nr:ComF family protein [Aphanothece sacrum]GBF82383.1 alpha-L-fucosidase [Aphanothece sacrum FPU1]GBF84283.1 alpha-L-fucosidase [Aphanothece sacrum FPU3]